MPHVGQAELIDFENFQVGDRVTDINSVTSAQGATIVQGPLAEACDPLQVITDPSDSNNQVIRGCTEVLETDITVNFSFPVDFVRVTFTDNPGGERVNIGALATTCTPTSCGQGSTIESVHRR